MTLVLLYCIVSFLLAAYVVCATRGQEFVPPPILFASVLFLWPVLIVLYFVHHRRP